MTGSHSARDGRRNGDNAARGRRRRRRSKARIAGVTAASFVVLLAAGAGWLYYRLDGNITTFGADGVSRDRPTAHTGGSNVLVIGSDSRSGKNSELGGGEGDVGRSDTAFLLHIYGDRKHALAVSIPRDALVDIPPCRLPDGSWTQPRSNTMFNSAFTVGETAQGNPACTQNTVEKLTGVRVDHTVVVDFNGFAKMTEAVGGVPVCVPQDVYQGDLNPNRGSRGERIFTKGPQTVEGRKALDYVRLRHGIGDGSDIGRIKRQQAFVSGLIRKIKEQGVNPTTLLPLANAATESLTVDPELGSAQKLLSFAMSLKDIDLHNTAFVTVPWRYQGARVAIVHPAADSLWASLRADRTLDGKDAAGASGPKKNDEPTAPASEGPVSGAGIDVTVLNGTHATGLGSRVADTLRSSGFTVVATTTAPTQDHTTTLISYGPGQEQQARTTARLFPGAELHEGSAPGIAVTLGSSYSEQPAPGATASSPSADGTVPSEVSDDARTADDDACAKLSYG
ncbi:LCP family protein [Streptomyces sp. NBC_01525]|uniref:LCP family protein n=1 Tax=Streptomyces sp. NBC_01525 TaxID=2903893 RepID=UPI003866B1EA